MQKIKRKDFKVKKVRNTCLLASKISDKRFKAFLVCMDVKLSFGAQPRL